MKKSTMKKTTRYGAVIRAGMLATGLLLSAGLAQGQQTKVFTDAHEDNSNWNNNGNWDGFDDQKPVAGENARIGDNLTCHIASADQAANLVQVSWSTGDSGTLIIRNGFTLTAITMSVGHNGNAAATGTLNQGVIVGEDNLQFGHLTSERTVVAGWAGALTGVYNHLAGTHSTDELGIGVHHPSFPASVANGIYNVLGSSATLEVSGTATLGADENKTGRLNVDASGASISFGRFTQNATGTLSFTADANGFSTLNVTGTEDAVTLAGTLLVELGLYEGSAPEIILISNAGTDAISGTFADVQLLNNSQGYELTYTGGDGNDLALVSGDPPDEPTFEEWVSGFGLEGDDALPEADPDGDGQTNYEEYLFGTDPTDPTSRYVVRASMNGDFEITFDTLEGRLYQVERSFDLSAESWTPIGTAIEGHGGSETVIDGDEISARAFYRVTVELL